MNKKDNIISTMAKEGTVRPHLIGFTNIKSIQYLIDKHLLPASIEFGGENWQDFLHSIDQELSNFKALGSMDGMRKIDMTAEAQCPECRLVFPVDLCTLKNIVS
jgi:hypothetical protein